MWDEIKELIDLGERVYNETPAFFAITLSTEEGICSIFISDKGFSRNEPYDGQYTLFIENGIQKDFNSRQFNEAKAHMLRLLGEEVTR